jgi:hypothetical protein
MKVVALKIAAALYKSFLTGWLKEKVALNGFLA